MDIVCLSPQGFLEIWRHVICLSTGKHFWEIEFFDPNDTAYSYTTVCGFVMPPEFWGREILGEL